MIAQHAHLGSWPHVGSVALRLRLRERRALDSICLSGHLDEVLAHLSQVLAVNLLIVLHRLIVLKEVIQLSVLVGL
jgi:hypothetical protein